MVRHVTRNAGLIVLGLLVAVHPAAAQNDEGSRPVEVLVGFDGVTSWMGDGHDVRLSISVPKGERLSLEFFGGSYHDDGTVAGGIYDTSAIYGFQIRQRISRWERPGIAPFLTYGVMGVFAHDLCSGHVCQPARPARVILPALGLFGLGVQHTIASHLALRVEAQGGFFFVIPVGLRVAAAIAVPLGRFTTRIEP